MKRLAVKPMRIRLFKRLMGVAAAIQRIPARVTPPPFRLVQMGSLFWQSRALYTAARLGVADALGDETREVGALAADLGLHEGHLYRLLRMLASLGIFEEVAPRRFRNDKTSAFLRRDNPKSVRAMVLMHNSPEMTAPWLEPLEACMRDGGIPFQRVHGAELFDYMDEHPEFDRLFSEAMDAVEGLTGNLFLEDFNWGAFERVIDVGGSKGSKAVAMIEAHPALEALVFDREQVIATAPQYWAGRAAPELLGRLHFEGGDMFETIPPARSDRDLYLFFAIFHGFSDEQCGQLLARLRAAVGPHRPSILIGDTVAAEVGIDPTTAAFDMQMLIGTRGRERTRREWAQMLEAGGFELLEVMDVRTFANFILARPR